MKVQEFEENSSALTANRLGLTNGMLVQEVGWDEDCDSALSEAIEDIIGSELLEDDTDEICDIVLL